MIAVQIGLILFLLLLLAFVYQDELRNLSLSRKATKANRFWKNGKDRRKSVRIAAQVDVLYELLSTEAAQKQVSKSRNISVGGINLALKEKLPAETFVRLQLNLPQEPRPIFATGKVVWIKEIFKAFVAQKEERFFATGIQFTQMSAQDETALHSFISGKLKMSNKLALQVLL